MFRENIKSLIVEILNIYNKYMSANHIHYHITKIDKNVSLSKVTALLTTMINERINIIGGTIQRIKTKRIVILYDKNLSPDVNNLNTYVYTYRKDSR